MDVLLEARWELLGKQGAFICRYIVEKMAKNFSHQRFAYEFLRWKETRGEDAWP